MHILEFICRDYCHPTFINACYVLNEQKYHFHHILSREISQYTVCFYTSYKEFLIEFKFYDIMLILLAFKNIIFVYSLVTFFQVLLIKDIQRLMKKCNKVAFED